MSEIRNEGHDDASVIPTASGAPADAAESAAQAQPAGPLTADAQPTVPLADAAPILPAPIVTPATNPYPGVTPAAPVQHAAPVQPAAPVQHALPVQPAAPVQPASPYAAPAHPAAAAQPAVPIQHVAAAPVGGHATHPQFGAAFGAPTATATPGASFGAAGTSAAPVAPKRSRGGMLVGALALVAIVGLGAGVGGAYLGDRLFTSAVATGTESGPQTVTINNPDDVNAIAAVSTKVLPSVVTLTVAAASASGSGSGVILSADGYVLTNTHVVTLGGESANATVRVTTSDGRIWNAKVVGTDPTYDLAVVKLEGASDLTPISWGDSKKLNVGDQTIAIGAPLGLDDTVTSGIVSALNRSISIQSSAVPDSGTAQGDSSQGSSESPFQFDLPGQQGSTKASTGTISISVIQTDAAINPGNSGGALVNARGELIGINVAIASAGSSSSGSSGNIGVGFAIPSSVAERVATEIMKDGAATHGLLGATVGSSTAATEGATVEGAVIGTVTDGGAAAKAGLAQGDIVTAFNGAPVSNATDLTAQVRALAAGSEAKLSYNRGGTSYDVTVTLGALTQ